MPNSYLYEVTYRFGGDLRSVTVRAATGAQAWAWVVWHYAFQYDEYVTCEMIHPTVKITAPYLGEETL